MAKKKKKSGTTASLLAPLREETKHSVLAIIFFVLGVFFLLSIWHKAGVAGDIVFGALDMALGVGYYILPLILFLLSLSFLRSVKPALVATKAIGGVVFFLSALGAVAILFKNGSGGVLGSLIARPLVGLFDVYVAFILLAALVVTSLLFIFDAQLKIGALFALLRRKKETDAEAPKDDESGDPDEDLVDTPEEEELDEEDTRGDEEPPKPEKKGFSIFGIGADNTDDTVPADIPAIPQASHIPYEPPPLSLLEHDKGKPGVGDIKARANMIKRTLQNFGITVEMDEISVGPSVTRYALKPAEGVKLSRIVGLQNDLGLALAAHPIRIEAPIPGKSLVGIEVPNSARTTVGLANLIGSREYTETEKPLLIALGKGVSGRLFYSDLAKLPHILIAGATGSGKSVTIHTLITSLLYRNAPENLRFIMVDPKRVELTLYNKIPHLLTPVITDPKKAILALKWAAKEMDRRYDILEAESVRDISSYHSNIVEPAYQKHERTGSDEDVSLPEQMPYIVVIIDELADIMTSYPRELEAGIVRLAQMSRAVGIHLVISTQRPSVNVITGLIKANIPGRIALQVSSQIDSRTILDAGGAEKLLGSGDMLYLSGDMAQPTRIQSAYVSETEVKRVVKHLADQYKDAVPEELNITAESERNSIFDAMSGESDDEDDDELYEDARATVMEAGKASTSYLQRKLKVGYARAARLMDLLEERGVIGPAEGSKPREVYRGDTAGYGETGGEEYNEDTSR